MNTTEKQKYKKMINLCDFYEEKRNYPRVCINTAAAVHKQNKYDINMILHDISPDGAQLRCNKNTAYIIHPTGKFITDETASEVVLNFTLPIDNKRNNVVVESKIYYFTIIENDVVVFGMKFNTFKYNTRRHVDNYINNSIYPAEEESDAKLLMPRENDGMLNQTDDKTPKFSKLNSSSESIFERLQDLEERLDNINN